MNSPSGERDWLSAETEPLYKVGDRVLVNITVAPDGNVGEWSGEIVARESYRMVRWGKEYERLGERESYLYTVKLDGVIRPKDSTAGQGPLRGPLDVPFGGITGYMLKLRQGGGALHRRRSRRAGKTKRRRSRSLGKKVPKAPLLRAASR